MQATTPVSTPSMITNIDQIKSGQIISIRSNVFENVFLRMDTVDLKEAQPSGGGTVNCQFDSHPFEKFRIHRHPYNTFTFESVHFPGTYLRMDGRNVDQPNGNGGGEVNGQFGFGPWEFFCLDDKGSGVFAIRSAVFNNVCLRMDGRNINKFEDAGAGTVNCQFGASDWEKFNLLPEA